jgi:hypothetical protein
MPATIATLRRRSKASAIRSLELVRDAAVQHLGLLKEDVIPKSNFWPSVQKYEYARVILTALDMLSEDGAAGSETVEVRLDDLEALVLFAHEFTTEAGRQPGSPIGNLTLAAFPDGVPGEEAPE